MLTCTDRSSTSVSQLQKRLVERNCDSPHDSGDQLLDLTGMPDGNYASPSPSIKIDRPSEITKVLAQLEDADGSRHSFKNPLTGKKHKGKPDTQYLKQVLLGPTTYNKSMRRSSWTPGGTGEFPMTAEIALELDDSVTPLRKPSTPSRRHSIASQKNGVSKQDILEIEQKLSEIDLDQRSSSSSLTKDSRSVSRRSTGESKRMNTTVLSLLQPTREDLILEKEVPVEVPVESSESLKLIPSQNEESRFVTAQDSVTEGSYVPVKPDYIIERSTPMLPEYRMEMEPSRAKSTSFVAMPIKGVSQELLAERPTVGQPRVKSRKNVCCPWSWSRTRNRIDPECI